MHAAKAIDTKIRQAALLGLPVAVHTDSMAAESPDTTKRNNS